jgi:two-component system, NtrC family, sensor histidine kinase HydH
VPADLAAVLRVCLREISRLNDAVTSVLQVGRPRSIEKRLCRVEQIIDESLSLIEPRLQRQNIRVERRRREGNDCILGDAGELSGVFLNLFINAIDAMPEGGVLSLETTGSNGEMRIGIQDSGPGIRPEIRDLIFQPFFTTKPSGSGIGLPLAMQVVRSHGGRLYYEQRSEMVTGANFVVVLPLQNGAAPRGAQKGGWRSTASAHVRAGLGAGTE